MWPGTWHNLLEVVLRTGVIYLFVLVGVRLSGKREVGQMTPFDLTLLLLLSNAVQNAMVGPDNSLVGGIVAAATLLVLNYLVAELSGANRRFRKAQKSIYCVRTKEHLEQRLALDMYREQRANKRASRIA